MKKTFTTGALIVVLLFAGGFMTGCAALEKARAIYEARQGEADEAREAWERAIVDLKKAEAEWLEYKAAWEKLDDRAKDAEKALEAAIESGDEEAIAKAKKDADRASNELRTLQDQGELLINAFGDAAKYADTAEATYKASEKVFKAAAEDLKNAESADDYIGTVLGWLGIGVTTLLGGGTVAGAVGTARNRRRADAVEGAAAKTASNAKASFSGDAGAWNAFLDAQEQAMTPAERAAFRKARGG